MCKRNYAFEEIMGSHSWKKLMSPRWYEREKRSYLADLERVEQYAAFVKQVQWKLYGTFTFAWRVCDRRADAIFAEFINRLERYLKANVAYVRGSEKRISGCGQPASGRHFHTLMTCERNMKPLLVEALWTSMAGDRDSGAYVQEYDPAGNAAAYVLKMMNDSDGGWDHRKLHLFHPAMNTDKINSRIRRSLRRHEVNQLGCSE